MYEAHNQAALAQLGNTGSVTYLHARRTLALAPTPDMAKVFDARAHRGLLRKYDTSANRRLLVADHGTSDRAEFEQCIRDCGYGGWTLQYTTDASEVG